jgi:hypothetical protein
LARHAPAPLGTFAHRQQTPSPNHVARRPPGSCIKFLRFVTNGGRTLEAGDEPKGVTTQAAPPGAHLYSLRGFFGPDCAGPAVEFVWGTVKCDAAKVAAAVVPVPTPVPVPVPTPVPVPVPVRRRGRGTPRAGAGARPPLPS